MSGISRIAWSVSLTTSCSSLLNRFAVLTVGIPGVCTVNLGVHNSDQLRQNVELVRIPFVPEKE